MKAALEKHKLVTLPANKTIADGIAVRRAGEITFPLAEKYVDDIVTVDDEEIANAILVMLEKEKTLTEGAGAVAAAAVLNKKVPLRGKKLGVLISGGNIDVTLLSRIIERGLVKDGRLLRIRIHLPDHPGACSGSPRVIADHKANIIETRHDRAYYGVVLGDTVIDITMETRGPEHIAEIESGLDARGLPRTSASSSVALTRTLLEHREYCCYCCCCAGCCGRSTSAAVREAPAVLRESCSLPASSKRRPHANVHGQALPRSALVDAAHRRHIAIIASVGDAHVPQPDRLAQRGIEPSPAVIRNQHFRPGVRSLPADDFFLLRIRPFPRPGTR